MHQAPDVPATLAFGRDLPKGGGKESPCARHQSIKTNMKGKSTRDSRRFSGVVDSRAEQLLLKCQAEDGNPTMAIPHKSMRIAMAK